MNTNLNLRKVKVPVLDVYAENDRDAKSLRTQTVCIGAFQNKYPFPELRHDYRGYETSE